MKTWRQINIKRIRYINYSTVVFARMFAEVRRQHADLWKRTGDVEARVSSVDVRQMVIKGFEETYTSTGVAFAQMQLETLKSARPGLKLKDADAMGARWREHMLAFVSERCGRKIVSVSNNLFEDLQTTTKYVIAEAAKEGWGAVRVADEILKRQKQLEVYKAIRIARTEVVGASNEGSYKGAGDIGIKVRKFWLATGHGDLREGHYALDNTSVAYDERFEVEDNDGNVDMMLYPHDPDASAGNVINCRCATAYEPEESYIDQILGG